MSREAPAREGEHKRYRPKKKAIVGVGVLIFIILFAASLAISNLRARNATQTILAQQREVEQSWLDKSLDAIRSWRNELAEQARFISSSEMFRLFMLDARGLPGDDLQSLGDPDTLHSQDETLRSMAEQYTYIQDLLRDFTRRRIWTDARILMPDGQPLVAPQFSVPLSDAQRELARKAAENGKALFGPIRRTDSGLMLDMADPLFEVLGASDPKAVGVLLLSVPMDQPLATFLARGDQAERLLPRIVFQDGSGLSMAMPLGRIATHREEGHLFQKEGASVTGDIGIEPVYEFYKTLEPLHFELRLALSGKGEVYSLGGMPTGLDWLFVVEIPAQEVEAAISSQHTIIYLAGALVAVGLTLLLAWLWSAYISHRHEADAIRYEQLYKTIRQQKMVLDSINASFKAGMALIDPYGRVQMSNPAFLEICGDANIKPGTPLVETLPDKAAITLLEDVNKVNLAGQSASDEIVINNGKEDRLYRVTLYPYSQANIRDSGGCVAILQDITEFRRRAEAERKKAEDERKRQDALISAFVRAVESIDPNLIGHSDKMAGVSSLLARKLKLDEREEKTLNLAAKLSQVGKIYVPRELLRKTDKLTEAELREIRRAPEYADRILRDLSFDLPVRETVALIGERVDGSGKPQGLTASQISLEGRALAVVNAFIAMTSSRAWRKDGGMSVEEAIRHLMADPGFDQNVVKALNRLDPEALRDIIQKNNEV